jgi:hypothetical protein
MKRAAAHQLLQRALSISRELSQLAESGDIAAAVALDADRLVLLRSVRASAVHLDDSERAVVGEIASLNNRALGLLEHRLRIKAREFDMAAVGRRAVAAYAATG